MTFGKALRAAVFASIVFSLIAEFYVMVAEGLTSLFAVRSSPPDSTMSDAAASAPIER